VATNSSGAELGRGQRRRLAMARAWAMAGSSRPLARVARWSGRREMTVSCRGGSWVKHLRAHPPAAARGKPRPQCVQIARATTSRLPSAKVAVPRNQAPLRSSAGRRPLDDGRQLVQPVSIGVPVNTSRYGAAGAWTSRRCAWTSSDPLRLVQHHIRMPGHDGVESRTTCSYSSPGSRGSRR